MIEIAQYGWAGVFFALMIGHALGDFGLQSEFVSEAKCQCYWKEKRGSGWGWLPVLLAHSLIHAGAVWLVTGSMACGLVELALHTVIDRLKCDGRFGFLTDQALHVFCKAGFVLWLVSGA